MVEFHPDHHSACRIHRVCAPVLLIILGVLLLLARLNLTGGLHLGKLFAAFIFILFGARMLIVRGRVMGAVLIALGAFLAAQAFGLWFLAPDRWWPVFLIVLGLALLLERLPARLRDNGGQRG